MRRTIALMIAICLTALQACAFLGGEDENEKPLLFQPGEYGGEILLGAEELYNIRLSPDGTQIALIRERTPDQFSDPLNQLWIMNRDGSNPEMIGVNVVTIDWSPDGKTLALTVSVGINFYVYTLDLETREATLWAGGEDQFFSMPKVGNPMWFQDGERLLVSVAIKAYKQPFERGIYTINTRTGKIRGPLVELFEAAFIGNNNEYTIGVKYTWDRDPLDGNAARYDFATNEWTWITSFPQDSLGIFLDPLVANPSNESVVFSRYIDNVWQLFLTNRDGVGMRQITELGGDNLLWSYDGRWIFFRRDMHKGKGARYVPFVYDMVLEEEAPLWPALPDSLPQFPAVTSQATFLQP